MLCNSQRDYAHEKLSEAIDAATPEAYAAALASLSSVLAQDCHESGARCSEDWGDRSAGAPWRRFARRLDSLTAFFAKGA